MNSNSRAESDRLKKRNWFIEILQRPEIGPFGVMLLLILALGFFSIPENANTWNLFEGEGLNALGIRNNLRIIAQLGIIALGAGLLIIAGEFDLSIGSMIGFAGMCMAITLKWGFHIVIPYISFTNGISVEKIVIASFNNVTPLAAVFITLCFTLFFGWLMGLIVVKTGLASFIVSLSFLFFLRGLTEVCYRAFNKAPDQTAGSTQVSDLPDFKNIVNLPEYGEIGRVAAKRLDPEILLRYYEKLSPDQIAAFSQKLSMAFERVAAKKKLKY
jgi:simple sugar transport system permease protein